MIIILIPLVASTCLARSYMTTEEYSSQTSEHESSQVGGSLCVRKCVHRCSTSEQRRCSQICQQMCCHRMQQLTASTSKSSRARQRDALIGSHRTPPTTYSGFQAAAWKLRSDWRLLRERRGLGGNYPMVTVCVNICQPLCQKQCFVTTRWNTDVSRGCPSCCQPKCHPPCSQLSCPAIAQQPIASVEPATHYRNEYFTSPQPISSDIAQPKHTYASAPSLNDTPCRAICMPKCNCVQKQLSMQKSTESITVPTSSRPASASIKPTIYTTTKTTQKPSTTIANAESPQIVNDALPKCLIDCQQACVQQCVQQELLSSLCSPSCISSCAQDCAHMQTSSTKTAAMPVAVVHTTSCLTSSGRSQCVCPDGFIICITPIGTGQCCQRR
ncbi:hypothetical protein Tcan_15981 [Toxocara canis]|uniref:Uncharacterized protein n=1 Tax=Toxocara canis TaxID=6265 RepID=A0A0B2W3E7_TOXCA|nr:hypothetical protein Tcan_15981 [Toxocara canis]